MWVVSYKQMMGGKKEKSFDSKLAAEQWAKLVGVFHKADIKYKIVGKV